MRGLRSLCFLILAGWLCAGPVWADERAAVLAARVETDDHGALLALTLDRPATARAFFLSDPDRFVVDVPAARVAIAQAPSAAGIVRGVRYAERGDGSARVVFDLAGAARLAERRTARSRAGRPELWFRLATAAPTALAEASPPKTATPPPRAPGRRVIVIDAGHGGKDPGASGVKVREKEVVLAAALNLRDLLEARGYEVALTRDGDTYLPLQERVRFARARQADLFISIHADSNGRATASGASVYTLSEQGGDRARAMMDAQNWRIDAAEGYSRTVENILVDLAQRETTNRSAEFAETLIGELGKATTLLRRTHRNAGYFVLLAPDVPAVLLELGFLTNADDEARLADPELRRQMMAAAADAIDIYFARPRAYAGGG